jgi:photosystem II stability/assembly factor-like uncharacterized protein
MKNLIILYSFIFCGALQAQKIEVLSKDIKTSIRGLSVVNDNVVWVSGSNGTVGLTLDGGKTFNWKKVKGFDSTDFRDIEAFSSTAAIIMGIGEPAYILKTIDAGATWKVVYENKTKGMFLDAMEFWNEQSGIVIGDPINGKFFFSRTFDEGNTWTDLPTVKIPTAFEGEACFASSGTNIRSFGKDQAAFISGGKKSRLFIKDRLIELPIIQGEESTGANSFAVNKKQKRIIIVGGDFTKKDNTTHNCVISTNKGKSFFEPTTPPTGYRSCVEFIKKKQWITCGLNGVDYSTDNGQNWTKISEEGFHVCRKAKGGNAVYLAGGNGKIGKLIQ